MINTFVHSNFNYAYEHVLFDTRVLKSPKIKLKKFMKEVSNKLRNSRKKTSFTLAGNFAKLLTRLGNSKFKNQDTHGNSTWVFLEHPWKFHFFFNLPLEFPYALSSIPLDIPCLQPSLLCSGVWIFSGIAHLAIFLTCSSHFIRLLAIPK